MADEKTEDNPTENKKGEAAKKAKDHVEKLLARAAAESSGSITLGGRAFDYRVHAAFVPVGAGGLDGASGEPQAAIMATAYLHKGVPAAERPVCFAFNGGPGSA